MGKKGVVRDSKVHEEVIYKVIEYARSIFFEALHLEFSPIKGPEGNIEYLLHLKKREEGADLQEADFSVEEVVAAAHKELD